MLGELLGELCPSCSLHCICETCSVQHALHAVQDETVKIGLQCDLASNSFADEASIAELTLSGLIVRLVGRRTKENMYVWSRQIQVGCPPSSNLKPCLVHTCFTLCI